MTYEEREAIFSKETLCNEDIQKLFGVCKTEATNIMMRIKRKTGDRLGVKGRLHIEDYLKHFGIEADRYSGKQLQPDAGETVAPEKEIAEETVSEVPLIRSSTLLRRNV